MSKDPLKAVFFLGEFTPLCGAPLHAWLASGHRVAAVVSYCSRAGCSARRRRDRIAAIVAPRWSVSAALKWHRIPLVQLASPVKWDMLAEQLAGFNADVLVSIGFQRPIPSVVTTVFRKGGVNLHPSLLPAYRGPYPVHAIVRDRAARRFGGMTLHCLSEQLDAGGIIAQEPLGGEAYTDRPGEGFGFARSAARLVSNELPCYCRGQCEPRPQEEGDWPVARIEASPLFLGPDNDLACAKALMSVFVPSPGIAVRVGERILRVGGEHLVIGLPTGQGPVLRRWTLDVDLADVRVRLLRENGVLRRWRRVKATFRLIREPVSI